MDLLFELKEEFSTKFTTKQLRSLIKKYDLPPVKNCDMAWVLAIHAATFKNNQEQDLVDQDLY